MMDISVYRFATLRFRKRLYAMPNGKLNLVPELCLHQVLAVRAINEAGRAMTQSLLELAQR
jgi:hypothetical protein